MSALARGRAGTLVGSDDGEYWGALLWHPKGSDDVHQLWTGNVKAIVPVPRGFVALCGRNHTGRGTAVEVLDHGDRFELGRSASLGGEPEVVAFDANDAMLIVTYDSFLRLGADFVPRPVYARPHAFYARSIALMTDGTVYLGTRGIVVEVRLSEDPPTETWLFPY